MGAAGRAAAALPGGHVEGFGDTFGALFRAIYADVVAGRPLGRSAYADFADGHDEMLVNDAIAAAPARPLGRRRSRAAASPPPPAGTRRAAEPDEARPADRSVSGHAARRGRRLDGRERLRVDRDRLLAARLGRDATVRRHLATSTWRTSRRTRPTRSSAKIAARASSSPASATTRTRSTPIRPIARGHRPPEEGDRRRGADGRPLVNTFMGADRAKTQDENWEDALRVWPDIVGFAQDHGRKITIENCPMLFSNDEWPGGHNLATTPRIWRRILEQWGGTIGLNFDPSHLILQMIDIPRFIREFGPHILHVQAKDLLDRPRRAVRARRVLAGDRLAGAAPARPRRRRLGRAVRGAVASRVRRRRDHRARGSRLREDRRPVKRGFLLARDVLRPYIK